MSVLYRARDFRASEPASESPEQLHRLLSRWNRHRLSPGAPTPLWAAELQDDLGMRLVEGAFLEDLRWQVAARALEAPDEPDAFIAWFEDLKRTGPGQGDPLFPYLAERATREELCWFLGQEIAGEAGFDDLVALTQVKMPEQAKLELARNYWDEMGQGASAGMHGPMLERLAAELGVTPAIEDTVWPALALGNALIAMAANRRYAWHAIGALGAVELTAPDRAAMVDAGLKRVGVGPARKYFALHAVLDVKHSAAWNAEVLRPLVAEDPSRARMIAEGALIRLDCGAACFEAYRAHLWGDPQQVP